MYKQIANELGPDFHLKLKDLISLINSCSDTTHDRDAMIKSLQTSPTVKVIPMHLSRHNVDISRLKEFTGLLERDRDYRRLFKRVVEHHRFKMNPLTHGECYLKVKKSLTGDYIRELSKNVDFYSRKKGSSYLLGRKGDIRQGEGMLEWPDGTKCFGMFKNDFKVGIFYYTYPDGFTFSGNYNREGKTGEWVYSKIDGSVPDRAFDYKENILTQSKGFRSEMQNNFLRENISDEYRRAVSKIQGDLDLFPTSGSKSVHIQRISWKVKHNRHFTCILAYDPDLKSFFFKYKRVVESNGLITYTPYQEVPNGIKVGILKKDF